MRSSSAAGRAAANPPAGGDRRALPPVVDLDRLDGVIFDIDGVVTDTALVHAAAWKRMFDRLLREHAQETGTPMRPFDVRNDYLRYVDGKPRLDGLRCFLASRGIVLPEGEPGDPPGTPTVVGLAHQKDEYFLSRLREHGVHAFPSTLDVISDLRRRGALTASVSASRNAAKVLEAANVSGLFDVQVDGQDAARMGLAGKPDPAMFVEAAHRLGRPPERLAVVEDALAGVQAGAAGGFGLVIGVDRGTQADDLLRCGASTVVKDLAQLTITGRTR